MISHRYNPVTKAYVSSMEDYGFTPTNATTSPLPPRPWGQHWPVWTGSAWELVPDYSERKAPPYALEDAQEATAYWLTGDTWDTPARKMDTLGPLPAGALLTRPEKPEEVALAEAKAAKTAEIEGGYQAAVAATLTMPHAAPTAQDVAVGAALLAAEDAEGLTYVVERHAATRADLLAQVEAAETVAAIEAVAVQYAV